MASGWRGEPPGRRYPLLGFNPLLRVAREVGTGTCGGNCVLTLPLKWGRLGPWQAKAIECTPSSEHEEHSTTPHTRPRRPHLLACCQFVNKELMTQGAFPRRVVERSFQVPSAIRNSAQGTTTQRVRSYPRRSGGRTQAAVADKKLACGQVRCLRARFSRLHAVLRQAPSRSAPPPADARACFHSFTLSLSRMFSRTLMPARSHAHVDVDTCQRASNQHQCVIIGDLQRKPDGNAKSC